MKAELLVSTCEPVSNHINAGEGGGTYRLAKGSGWIRVNLDTEVWSEDADFEMIDASDMLVESDKDVYGVSEEEQVTLNSTDDYDDDAGNSLLARNDLERAVLTPNHEESAVYVSPGVEKESTEGKAAGREVEVGLGAVLSLFCLSALLFLINCLPCALREHKRRRTEEEIDCTEQDDGEEHLQSATEVIMSAENDQKVDCLRSQV